MSKPRNIVVAIILVMLIALPIAISIWAVLIHVIAAQFHPLNWAQSYAIGLVMVILMYTVRQVGKG